jgi:hypothetical protein
MLENLKGILGKGRAQLVKIIMRIFEVENLVLRVRFFDWKNVLNGEID